MIENIKKKLYELFVDDSPLIQLGIVKNGEVVDIFEAKLSTLFLRSKLTKRFKLRKYIEEWISRHGECNVSLVSFNSDDQSIKLL